MTELDQVRSALAFFWPNKSYPIEVRLWQRPKLEGIDALDNRKKTSITYSGFFDDEDALLREVEKFDEDDSTVGIFCVMNPIRPGQHNVENKIKRAGKATKDEDIVRRHALLIDIDPTRAKGFKKYSSTDEEKEHARRVRDFVVEILGKRGWPEPCKFDSGNGYHLLYRINLSNDDHSNTLLRQLLKTLNRLLPNDIRGLASVDEAVFNASRVTKLPGTMVRKNRTDDRPWRLSRVISVPDQVTTVSEAQIRSIVELDAGRDEGKFERGTTTKRSEARYVHPERSATQKGLDSIENDEQIRPCIKTMIQEAINSKGVWWPHNARLTTLAELLCAGYSDRAVHDLFEHFEDYDFDTTQNQVSHCRSTYLAKGGTFWKCSELRDRDVVAKDRCKGCNWTITRSDAGDNENAKGNDGSVATILTSLVLESGAQLWHNPEGEAYITISQNQHLENHPLNSKQVTDWMSGLYYKSEQKVPHSAGVKDALNVLEGLAVFEGDEHETHVRFAEHGGNIYLDLANGDWMAVEVTTQGWKVISSHEVPLKFRRTKGMLSLPEPATGGSLEDLRKVVNVPQGDAWILVTAWLLQAFRPAGPYPPLVVLGEPGSAKSWLTRTLKYLTDPNVAPLRRPPKSERDLMIAASNGWVVAYDNLSGLSPWLSDGICVLSTGGGLAQRQLYTDSDESLLDVQRPVILNGIDEIATRGDLANRAIFLYLPRIGRGDRRTETEIKSELDQIRPGVIGTILDAVSRGLRELPNVDLDSMPRMADFAEWITACSGGDLGWCSKDVLEAFSRNQVDANVSLVYNDMFCTSLVQFIETGDEPFEDNATFLLTTLNNRCGVNGQKPDGWPRSARGVTDKLRNFAGPLRDVGVNVQFVPRTNKKRIIRISKIEPKQCELPNRDASDGKDDTEIFASPEKPDTREGNGDGVTQVTDNFELEKKRVKREEDNEVKKSDVLCSSTENYRHLRHSVTKASNDNGFGGDGCGDANDPIVTTVTAPWSKVSGAEDIVVGLKRYNGRLTRENMIEDFGWNSKQATSVFGLLVDNYEWISEKLKSGLTVYRPPKVTI